MKIRSAEAGCICSSREAQKEAIERADKMISGRLEARPDLSRNDFEKGLRLHAELLIQAMLREYDEAEDMPVN
jgi:hypothetical protein